MSKNYRQQSLISKVSDEDNNGDHWLKEFEKNLEKSAVQPRTQESLFDQINSVMNGAKSKHKSVALAVEDMKERSGLTAYLNKVKLSNTNSTIKTAAKEDPFKNSKLEKLEEEYLKLVKEKRWLEAGKICGKVFKLIDGTNTKTKIAKIKVPKVFSDDWALGFSQTSGKKSNDDELKKFKDKFASEDNNNSFDKKIDVDCDIVPLIIKKVPNIKNTLKNYITDFKGTLSIPAILEKLKSIHQADVSDDKDWDDDDLLKLISKLNLKAKSENPVTFKIETNLGTRDNMNDSDLDSANTDAFSSLNPVNF